MNHVIRTEVTQLVKEKIEYHLKKIDELQNALRLLLGPNAEEAEIVNVVFSPKSSATKSLKKLPRKTVNLETKSIPQKILHVINRATKPLTGVQVAEMIISEEGITNKKAIAELKRRAVKDLSMLKIKGKIDRVKRNKKYAYSKLN